MVNTNIPLAASAAPDTASAITTANQQQNQNALDAERILRAQYETMDMREKSRLTSTIAGASQLKAYLDRDDLEGAHEFLLRRQQQLHGRIASGENVDTQETDYALDALRRGNIDQLKNDVGGIIAAGQVYGIINRNDMPANVQEWQYYNSLSEDDQKKYLNMKRSNQTVNLGGTQMVIGPDGRPVANYGVTPKPDNMPDFRREQAAAEAEGKAAGEQAGGNQKKQFDSLANQNYIKKAITLLPQSTNGGIATAVKSGTQAIGVSTEASRADRQLKILSAKLVGTVPRFEGPQGVLDVQLYQEAAGDLANTELPVEDRQAAAQLMLDLLDEYGATGVGGPAAPAPSRIRVQNPQTGEAFEIDASDLSAAQKDGFVQQ